MVAMVDRGKVCGSNEVVPSLMRSEVRLHRDPSPGTGTKIFKSPDAQHHAGDRLWNIDLGGIGETQLIVHQVAMKLGVERTLNLGRSTAEKYPGAGAGVAIHRQALRLQPGGNFGEVGVAHAKTGGVLFRGQPFAEVRGVRVLLLRQ